MIQIELPNIPVPWTASRITTRGSFNPKGKEKNFTRWQIKSIYREDPIPGYVVLDFVFFMRIPHSASKRDRVKMLAGEIIPTNVDATNCQKFYEDCLKQIIITDDRNVAKISSEKLYGDKEKILIRVWPLEEYRQKNNETLNR